MKTPFDGRFKLLAEEHPELLLLLFGIISRGTKIQPENHLRELQLDAVHVDHLYRIAENGAVRMVHFEAITQWSSKRVPVLALDNFLIKHKFKLPVSSYVILMAEKYAPKAMPARVVYEEDDGFRIEVPYHVIRLWEIDPSLAFEPGCEAFLPWVPLLKGGFTEFERASEAIGRLVEHPEESPYPVEAMVSSLATLATLRYDKDAIKDFLDKLRRKIMISTEELRVSWLYQDGLAEGKAEGKVEGRAEGTRAAIRLALGQKFPNFQPAPEIDHIVRSEVLDELLLAIIKAQNADEGLAAIRAAN